MLQNVLDCIQVSKNPSSQQHDCEGTLEGKDQDTDTHTHTLIKYQLYHVDIRGNTGFIFGQLGAFITHSKWFETRLKMSLITVQSQVLGVGSLAPELSLTFRGYCHNFSSTVPVFFIQFVRLARSAVVTITRFWLMSISQKYEHECYQVSLVGKYQG